MWTRARGRTTGKLLPEQEREVLKEAGGGNGNLTEQTVTGKGKDGREILRSAVNIRELDSKYI